MNEQSILEKSFKKAMGGGLSGAVAMTTQVSTLMWLRTTVNYQYRYGGSTINTIKLLYKEGGIPRFYRGFIPALMQGSLARFGDTAANTGIMYYMNNNEHTKNLPVGLKSSMCSGGASLWRVFIMPVDTFKTSMQVNGKNGISILKNKVNTNGFRVLYNGSSAAMSATYVGHFPWFLTYNYLNERYPPKTNTLQNLIRNGAIGFSASVVSDTCSNSLRIIKTNKQTHKTNISYKNVIENIIKKDGLISLFTRGLKTKIISNGIQGGLFAITWKYFENKFI